HDSLSNSEALPLLYIKTILDSKFGLISANGVLLLNLLLNVLICCPIVLGVDSLISFTAIPNPSLLSLNIKYINSLSLVLVIVETTSSLGDSLIFCFL